MSEPYYISDTPLPLSQDFKKLKQEGLAYIQKYAGNSWTNLNPVDPGITILDQVCYALTELGYCNDFPIRDILTRPDGTLEVEDQFYLPQDILTTSPVTIDDYRKYLADGISNVGNATISLANDFLFTAYNTYIQPIDNFSGDGPGLCETAFFYLNQSRNLGEVFLQPEILEKQTWQVIGTLETENEQELQATLHAVQIAVRDYIFPQVKESGYDHLTKKGITADEVFNGPLLQDGWIETTALGEKKDSLGTIELSWVIASVPGVRSAMVTSFELSGQKSEKIACKQEELITIDINGSFSNQLLVVSSKGKTIAPGAHFKTSPLAARSAGFNTNILFGSSVSIQTSLPAGKFRDINRYYSIQNTFPEVFAVGADSVVAGAPEVSNPSGFQIAQSRQLKAYLTLFDQVLANQFSQLANIGQLFSFRNALSMAPSDERAFYAVKNKLEKHEEYPVPYRSFSPTYFCQSLYHVPHIKPLLKDNDTFGFNTGDLSPKELEQQSWQAYQKDPYNPYMRGLMEAMENGGIHLERRNAILDHLLARHGESPLVFNALISGSVYSGDPHKDQVIFKSLYLQNLGLLSYYRCKAYNFMAAPKIRETLPEIADYREETPGDFSLDFIFNTPLVDHIEKLDKNSFSAYSALELRLHLLFGLRTVYGSYISENRDTHPGPELRLAAWLITERKGFILLEHALLAYAAGEKEVIHEHRLTLIFPAFIPLFTTPEFQARLDLFLDESLPVQLSCRYHFLDSSQLTEWVAAFSIFHNSLTYKTKDEDNQQKLQKEAAARLITLLSELKTASE